MILLLGVDQAFCIGNHAQKGALSVKITLSQSLLKFS